LIDTGAGRIPALSGRRSSPGFWSCEVGSMDFVACGGTISSIGSSNSSKGELSASASSCGTAAAGLVVLEFSIMLLSSFSFTEDLSLRKRSEERREAVVFSETCGAASCSLSELSLVMCSTSC